VRRRLLLAASHLLVGIFGFALGIYLLPILIAPSGPSPGEIAGIASGAKYTTEFRRDLKGSDFLHWGEGKVSITPRSVAFEGKLAPGPDYKLYLVPEFVETKEDFTRVKAASIRVGDIKTFENFVVPVAESIDVARYSTVVVWCESFSMFITAAKYR
jgi:Electron transfer DM13